MQELSDSPAQSTQLFIDALTEIKDRHKASNPKFANVVDTLAEYVTKYGIEEFVVLDNLLRSIPSSPAKDELLQTLNDCEEGKNLIDIVQGRTKKMNRREFLFSSVGHLTMYGTASAFLGLVEYGHSLDANNPPAIQKMHQDRAANFAGYTSVFASLGLLLHGLENRDNRLQANKWIENFCLEYANSGLLPVLSAEMQTKGISPQRNP